MRYSPAFCGVLFLLTPPSSFGNILGAHLWACFLSIKGNIEYKSGTMAYVARFRKERVNTTRVVAGFVFLGRLFP